MKPRTANAWPSSDLTSILHAALTAIPCAVLLTVLGSYALTLLALRPLEMLCAAVIVWRSRGGGV